MNLILIAHLGQEHIAEHSVHDVIDLLQILGFSNNPTAPNVQRGKLLLRHGLRMVMRTNATPSFQTGILVPNSIAESPLGNVKQFIATHEGESACIIFPKMNRGIELMDELNIKVTVD